MKSIEWCLNSTEEYNGQIIDSKCAPSNKNENQPSNSLWIIIIIIIDASLPTLPIFFCSFYRLARKFTTRFPPFVLCMLQYIPSVFLSIPKAILMEHTITVIIPDVIMIQRYECAYLCASKIIPSHQNAEQKEHNHQQIAWDGNNQNQIKQPTLEKNQHRKRFFF